MHGMLREVPRITQEKRAAILREAKGLENFVTIPVVDTEQKAADLLVKTLNRTLSSSEFIREVTLISHDTDTYKFSVQISRY